MKTSFYTNAKEWVNESQRDVKSKNYFSSWMKTLPARLNFLADAIVNISFAPFNLLKAGFGSIKTTYTWGEDTEDLTDGLKGFHGNVNHIISDGAGLVVTKAGCNLRNTENVVTSFRYYCNDLYSSFASLFIIFKS